MVILLVLTLKVVLLLAAVWSVCSAELITVEGYEGGKAEIRCPYKEEWRSQQKYLCKGDCSVFNKDKVIKTEAGENRASKGRYSLKDNREESVFIVTIANLTLNDAGRYWCGVDKWGQDNYIKVNLEVSEAGSGTLASGSDRGSCGGRLVYARGGDMGSCSCLPSAGRDAPEDEGRSPGSSTNNHQQNRTYYNRIKPWFTNFFILSHLTTIIHLINTQWIWSISDHHSIYESGYIAACSRSAYSLQMEMQQGNSCLLCIDGEHWDQQRGL